MTIRPDTIVARRGARGGQILPLYALTLVVFIGALLLGVDLSRLRTEAENAQRAADAAALAGVIYMPNYSANAYSRALAEARKNKFGDDSSHPQGVHVVPGTVDGYPTRLRVTISESVPLLFGHVFGLGLQRISRTAVAEYYQPLQSGSPDYVLGYAPFPTSLASGGTEGFYLENKGQYTYKDMGDAYSPLFESFAGQHFHTGGTDPSNTNPCTGPCTGLTANGNNTGAATGSSQFQGYDYVIDDPVANTLVIKIFNPYDEISYDSAAQLYDQGASSRALAPSDSAKSSAAAQLGLGHDSTKDYSTYTTGACYISVGQNCTKLIDQGSHGANSPFGSHEVTLAFRLSGPAQTPYDTNVPQIGDPSNPRGLRVSGPSDTNNTTCLATTSVTNCVYVPSTSTNPAQVNCPSGDFCGGNDPTAAACTPTDCLASPYAFRFLNYAIIHGPGIFHLRVSSTVNADFSYGTRGHAYGIAACASTNPLDNPNLGNTSDPYTNAGPTVGWNQGSCYNPNTTTNCANPAIPSPTDKCIHVYGMGRMGVHNWITGIGSSTDATIPLGYVPASYAGKTLRVRLYDVGDISGSNDLLQVLTPAGTALNNNATTGQPGSDGNGTQIQQKSVNGVTYDFPTTLPYKYSASPNDGMVDSPVTSGYVNPVTMPSPQSPTAGNCDKPLLITTNSTATFEGVWLNIDVPLNLTNCVGGARLAHNPTYRDMVSAFGGYWKMLYHVNSSDGADDGTTWEISVAGSPVHLVSG